MTIFIVVLVLLVFFVERYSLEKALDGVTFHYETAQLLVEPEESFEIITTVTNTSKRFIPFIRIEETLPAEMAVHAKNAKLRRDIQGNLKHISSIYLMPRSRFERRLPVSLPCRGRYFLRGGELRGGDFLGISEKTQQAHVYGEIVVYPLEIKSPDILQILGGFLGDVSVRRFILEDPVLTIGTREYTGKEPMKNIAWNHTARQGRLMVKQFDYTLEPSVTVLLNIECAPETETEYKEALIEDCYSLVRSICQTLENQGIKYDFITNAATGDAFAPWSYKAEGLGNRHFFSILEGLGRASYHSVMPYAALIDKTLKTHENARSTLIVTPQRVAEHQRLNQRLENTSGAGIIIISAEEVLDEPGIHPTGTM